MPKKNDHRGRTVEEEYRHIRKHEGSDRMVINHLITERYFAVKTMIHVRNKAVEIILKDLGNLIETDNMFELPVDIHEKLKEIDKLVMEWSHVANMKDHPID